MNLELRKDVMTAKDSNIIYIARNLVCDGSNFFDTGFAPYSSGNINKDFKITMRLSSITLTGNQDTVLACKYEDGTLGGQSYPGFVIRRNSTGSTLQVGGYNYWTPQAASLVDTNLYLWRASGSYYAQLEGGSVTTLSVRSTTFDHTILIGATRNASDSKMRYGYMDVDYIRIEYL